MVCYIDYLINDIKHRSLPNKVLVGALFSRLRLYVGVRGLEPPSSCSQSKWYSR